MVDDFRRNFAHSNNQDCTTSDEAFVTFRVSRFTPNDDSCDSSVTCDSAVAGDSSTDSAPISSTNSLVWLEGTEKALLQKSAKVAHFQRKILAIYQLNH